jgi:UDP-GlcNAc:undecaprenyl-phosphate GlcNAc-1-phosphate transferase
MSYLNLLFYFILSISFLYLSFFISLKFKLIDKPSKNKIHTKKTPNAAGLALIPLSIIFMKFTNESSIINIFFLLLISIIIIGFADDRLNFKPNTKILLLFIITIIFVIKINYLKNIGNFFEFEIYMGKYGTIFTIGCLLLIINSTNYIDGQDGMLGFLMVISLVYFLNFTYKNPDSYLIILLIIYNLSFLLFNLNILPKQFFGDSGSLANGFALAFVSIHFVVNLNIIDAIVVIWPLAFYVFEFISINIVRYKNKKNILNKDLNFIFNYFSRKYSLNKSLIFCVIIHIVFCITGYILNIKNISNDYQIILFIFYFLIYFYIRLKMKFVN